MKIFAAERSNLEKILYKSISSFDQLKTDFIPIFKGII